MKLVQRILVVLLVVSLCLGSVQGNGRAAATGRPTLSDLINAKEDYIKNLPAAQEVRTGPDGVTAYTMVDGFVIPPDVEKTAEYKAGNVRVFVDSSLPALVTQGPLPVTETGVLAATAPSRQAQQVQLDQLAKAGIAVSNPRQYFVAYNGFSITTRLADLGHLADVVGRSNVHIAKSFTFDLAHSVPLIGAGPTGVGGAPLNLDGTGLYIGVVDTGIDYTHPDFGGTPSSTFPTVKVPYGYDFGDNDTNPMDTNGHGTHVSGIVAADGTVKGVAPKAKIVIAKIVEGGTGSAWSDAIIAAFEYMADAAQHGGHVVSAINMSFGSDAGLADPTDPEQQAIENCVTAGIPVALAAGNAGTFLSDYGAQGIFPDTAMVGSPSITPGAMSVASSENTWIPGIAVTETSAAADYIYLPAGPTDPTTLGDNAGTGYTYVACGYGAPSDFPSPFPANTIALVSRGALDPDNDPNANFTVKILNAANAGAIGVIVYNHASGGEGMINMAYPDGQTTIPAMFVQHSAGLALLAKSTDWSGYSAGDESGRLKFLGHFSSGVNPDADTISTFSSWGPTPSLSFKPELTAPGGNIWSTVPVAQGSYANYSGTSMASPHVAAAAALLKGYKNWTPLQIKTALSNTGILLVDPQGDAGTYASPRAQGAGRINVQNALSTPVFVTDLTSGQPNVVLGQLAASPVTFTLHLTNTTGSPVTYSTSHTIQSTYNWYVWQAYGQGPTAVADISSMASISESATVTVPAGGSTDVPVTLDLTSTDLSVFYTPFVEGFLTFASAGLPSLHIPYMGYLGAWNDFNRSHMPKWYRSSGYNPILDMPSDDPYCFFGNWVYDIPPAGVKPDDYVVELGKDFLGHLVRDDIAISTQATSYHLQARVVPLRTSQSLDISITDGTNVVKPIETVTGLPKSAGYYVGNEVPWEWRGENSAGTGFVSDGQYYLKYVAQPAAIVGQAVPDAPQVMSFPVKLDSVSPVVTITTIDPIPSGRQVNWTVSDAAPSSGIWGFDVWYTNGTGSHHVMVPPTTASYVIPGDATDTNVYAWDNANNVSSFEAATVHTILATARGSGIVTPSGAISIPFGSDQSFAFVPAAGMNVVSVAVDGVNVNAWFGITFHHVVADHTLDVAFADVTPPSLNLPTVMGGLVNTSSNPWLLPFEAMDSSGSIALMTVKDNGAVILNRVPAVSPLSLNLADGMHSIQVIAEDTAGNATVKSFLLLVDTHGPLVDVTTPATPVSVPAYVLTGSVVDLISGLRSLTVNDVDNATYLDGTFTFPVTLKKGLNTFTVVAIDNMGNKTVREATVELASGATPPSYKTVTLTIGKPEMDVNGMPVAMDAAPVIKNGRTLLPIRALIEMLGGRVTWDAKTRTATVVLGARSVVLEVGKSTVLVNGKYVPIDASNAKVVPEIIGSRTFLPLRFIAESLGLDLTWEPVSQTISFTYWP